MHLASLISHTCMMHFAVHVLYCKASIIMVLLLCCCCYTINTIMSKHRRDVFGGKKQAGKTTCTKRATNKKKDARHPSSKTNDLKFKLRQNNRPVGVAVGSRKLVCMLFGSPYVVRPCIIIVILLSQYYTIIILLVVVFVYLFMKTFGVSFAVCYRMSSL